MSLNLLLVEDSATDAELVIRELRRAGFDPKWTRVETEADYLANLHPDLDVILSDYNMPDFCGLRALSLLKERGLEIPFILVSGTIGEETAVAAMKEGATDYLLKDRLARLEQAVRQALEKHRLRKERNMAEETLRESEERFRQLAENIEEVFWLFDVELGRVLYVSPAYETIWGRSRAELYKSPNAWREAIYPEDRAKVVDLSAQLETGKPYNEEFRIQRPDGSIRWIHDRSFLVREASGQSRRVVGVAGDITQRKVTEERIYEQAEMLGRAHEAIIVRDVHTRRITFWNQGAERLYGWSSPEALGMRTASSPFIDPCEPIEIYQELLESEEWSGELRRVNKMGQTLVISSYASVVRGSDGNPKSVLTIHIDITERRSLETQLLRAQRLESIGSLASGLAHDLNNTLAPILMCTPLLRGHLSSGRAESIISTIEKSGERAADIVKQVLTFSRGSENERRTVPVQHLLREMVKVAQATFPKSIRVQEDHAAGLWLVNADPTQLHQILMNLCVNARDAMPNGGTLRLSARNASIDPSYASMIPDALPGFYVVVEARDTGCGIEPAILDRIFDPFFTTKAEGKGTGLGLPSVKGIVKSHGGFLQVESEVGVGTTFQIYLPAQVEAPEPPLADAQPTVPDGAGELILLIDDEASVRAMGKIVLETHGYQVLTATEGTEGVAIYAQNLGGIAAVVTDLAMPFLDGIGLIRALRKINPEVKIIASTGQTEPTRIAELNGLNVGMLLYKPYAADALLSSIHAALHSEVTAS